MSAIHKKSKWVEGTSGKVKVNRSGVKTVAGRGTGVPRCSKCGNIRDWVVQVTASGGKGTFVRNCCIAAKEQHP